MALHQGDDHGQKEYMLQSYTITHYYIQKYLVSIVIFYFETG